MFESRERLREEIELLLGAIREQGRGRYACLLDARQVLFESAEPGESGLWALRQLFDRKREALLGIPGRLAREERMDDIFAGWDDDEFFLAVVNGRVALAVVCPEAEPLREATREPLTALVDRLFRYDERYRLDLQGRGFFFGRPKLDLVVIGRAGGAA